MTTFFYAHDGHNCPCGKSAIYVAVDEESKTAAFFCDDCFVAPEIKTTTWLGNCPPYKVGKLAAKYSVEPIPSIVETSWTGGNPLEDVRKGIERCFADSMTPPNEGPIL